MHWEATPNALDLFVFKKLWGRRRHHTFVRRLLTEGWTQVFWWHRLHRGRLIPKLVDLLLLVYEVLDCSCIFICLLVLVIVVNEVLDRVCFRVKTLSLKLHRSLVANALYHIFFFLQTSPSFSFLLLLIRLKFRLQISYKSVGFFQQFNSFVELVHQEVFGFCSNVLLVVDETIFYFRKLIRTAYDAGHLVQRCGLI